MKKILITLIVLLVIGGAAAGAYYYKYGKPPEPVITTAQMSRGDIIQQVGATGTIEAVTMVDVGTQVNGVILEMFTDFNRIVHKGDKIAKIDPKTIEATIDSDKANLESAMANLERQRISLEDSKNKLKRAEDLFKRNLLTQQDLETAQVTVKTNEASIKAQEASIKQTQAKLNQDQVSLGYTDIFAPIDGIVINRKVDVGQTVVSNNQATSMFQIAADLTKMQVKASVDESDVGLLRPDQHVTFRVDAFPNKEFVGRVSQVRLQPVVTQNVVTYTVIIDVPNPNLELRPGMTANVKIEIARRENVLRVPMAALRYRPAREIFEALNIPVPPEMQQRARGQGGQRGPQNAMAGGQANGGQQAQNGTRGGAAFERGGGDRATQPADRQTSFQRELGPQPGGRQQGAEGQQARGDRQGMQQGGGGRGGGQGQGGERQAGEFGGRGGQGGQQMTPEERQKRMQERLAQMTPEERARFEERMKQFQQGGGRGGGQGQGGNFGGGQGGNYASGPGGNRGMGGRRNQPAANEVGPNLAITERGSSNGTIDALFGALQFSNTPGRVWVYAVNGTTKSLKSLSLVRGIDDGTFAELVSGDGIDENTKLVTSIDTGQQTTSTRPNANPLMPGGGQRGMGGPMPGGGGGGRGR